MMVSINKIAIDVPLSKAEVNRVNEHMQFQNIFSGMTFPLSI